MKSLFNWNERKNILQFWFSMFVYQQPRHLYRGWEQTKHFTFYSEDPAKKEESFASFWMQFDIKMENGKKAKVWIGALSLQNKGDLYTQGFGRKCNGRPIITLPPRLDWRQSSFFASLNARNHKILLALYNNLKHVSSGDWLPFCFLIVTWVSWITGLLSAKKLKIRNEQALISWSD